VFVSFIIIGINVDALTLVLSGGNQHQWAIIKEAKPTLNSTRE